MTDDLTTRLRESRDAASNEAADEIDRLRAELSSMTIQRDTARLTSMNWESGFSEQEARADTADAQIAEALACIQESDQGDSFAPVEAILSRGSQGAGIHFVIEHTGPGATVVNRPDGTDVTLQSGEKTGWADPEPWLTTGRTPERFAWPRSDGDYLPRTREQFDAEQEANRG